MRAGFTLVEVVVALLVLEVGMLGAVGTFLVAARTLERAEAVQRGVAEAGDVLDSLRTGGSPGTAVRSSAWGTTSWSVSEDGSIRIHHASRVAGVVFDVCGVLAPTEPGVP